MGIADELLALAEVLSEPGPGYPEQASFRRSVSTAYYALFHLLVEEAVQLWAGSSASRRRLERVFEHVAMKDVSESVRSGSWKGWSGSSGILPSELKDVAEAFVDLQQARHTADYSNGTTWTHMDVRAKVAKAQTAIRKWRCMRTEPVAHDYLLSLLIGRKRR
jgi:hypothetical protein